MKKVIILLVLISGMLIVSCESNTTQEIQGVVTNPTYNANVAAVFTAKCIGCHSAGAQYPDLDTYANVKDAIQNGTVICRIDDLACGGDVMPTDGKMDQNIIDMIKLWRDQGFVN